MDLLLPVGEKPLHNVFTLQTLKPVPLSVQHRVSGFHADGAESFVQSFSGIQRWCGDTL